MSKQRIIVGHVLDALATLPDQSVHCIVTSPPYLGQRSYETEPQAWPDGWIGSLGHEPTLALYIDHLLAVFRECRRVLQDSGTFWLNIGDSYASAWPAPHNRKNVIGQPMSGGKRSPLRQSRLSGSLKEKDLMLVPSRLAIALQDDGWYIRSDIIWEKPSPIPDGARDRPNASHEHIFLLARSEHYYYNQLAVRDDSPGKRRLRNVWSIPTESMRGAHSAVFPREIPRRAIKLGCPPGGVVLDPFVGSGRALLVAAELDRDGIGIELSPAYADLASTYIREKTGPMFTTVIVEDVNETAILDAA